MEREEKIAARNGPNTVYAPLDAMVAAEPRPAILRSEATVDERELLGAPVEGADAQVEQPGTYARLKAEVMMDVEKTLRAMQAQLNELQKQSEAQDERIAGLVENINLLRGDQQRKQQAKAA